MSKPSNLSQADQQKLLKIVLQEGVDAWKKVSETLGLKSSKEAIFEFLRIEDKTILQAQKYLIEHAEDLANEIEPQLTQATQKRFSETAPLDQVDHLFLQCSLLSKLADLPKPVADKTRKRESKLKRKLAQKCLLTEFCQMRTHLNHLVKRDNELASARNDLRNLQGQLFTERVAMSTNN